MVQAISFTEAMMAYRNVEKLDRKTGSFTCYFPLRVVGLAYELGHKLAEQRGCQVDSYGDSVLWIM